MNCKSISKITLIVFILLISLACSVKYNQPDEQEDFLGDTQEESSSGEAAGLFQSPEKKPVLPVGLNKGLSSLNSYTYEMRLIMNGPSAQDRNETKVTTSYYSDDESTMTRTESFASSADEPEGDRSVSTVYRVGETMCTISDDEDSEAEIEDLSPASKEMLNIFMNLSDTVINVEDPELVGTEMVSGVNCNHYQFTVIGLGKTSGAEVTQSQGEYWSAIDGNYLVKYDVILETRNAPEGDEDAEILHTEMHFLLFNVNSTSPILLPAECS